MVEEEDASAEAEEVRQERMGLTPDWLIDVRYYCFLLAQAPERMESVTSQQLCLHTA